MDLITVDFETFYDKDFSLSKLTTEEYIRDPQFEVIGLGVKVNDGETEWASGTPEQIERYLRKFNWGESAVLAHNTMFDGAILSWCYGVRPRLWLDTLCMGRALHGVEVGGSLKALAERYGLGEKGTEVLNAKGKRRNNFTPEELDRYGDYCVNDVDLTHNLFRAMRTDFLLRTGSDFPKQELRLIDLTLRMFIEPKLDLDLNLLEQHLYEVKQRKEELLENVGVDKKELMSNPKFADLLRDLGVEPPMKISPTTGKQTYAFAKSDEEFKALQEHEDDRVQALVTARLGTKSTLEETRTQRFIDIAKRGLLPVPVRYYAAHTGRWGGDDKINMQNLPSRGPNAKKLKSSIIAPPGHVLIDADSSQIEARVLAWLAEQKGLVQAFFNKDDVYKEMASRIYAKEVDEIDKDERFVGKTTILGAGYGMGAVRFQAQLKTFGYDLTQDECRRIIDVYRGTNWRISQFWREAQTAIEGLARGESFKFGVDGLLHVYGNESAIRLPSGLFMRYDDLKYTTDPKTGETGYTYKTRRGRTRLYGGKLTENVCQAVARCIIGEQMLRISKRYRVVLTVHDSIVCCVPEEEVQEAQAFVEACMRWVPDWANGLPIDCESGIGRSYGECE